MKTTLMSGTRLRRCLRAFQGAKRILVLTHDYPDPDAVASALALQRILVRRLGCEVDIGYGGIVGRAENRALVKAVHADLKPLEELDFASYDAFALVDTQPRTGNNSLPFGRVPAVVIDHHPMRGATRRVKFHDIRTRYGATATMLYEYLKAARFRMDPDLATALFYGIQAETQSLSREASRRDREAYVALFPHVDFRKISEIEYAGVSRVYFAKMGTALSGTTLYGDLAVTSLGEIANPELCAEFCDMILRLETVRWALCMGYKSGTMVLSLRTKERPGRAGGIIARVVGKEGMAGGHGMMAGGIAFLDRFDPPGPETAREILTERFLEAMDATGRKPENLLDFAGFDSTGLDQSSALAEQGMNAERESAAPS
jgi:nanoRNase/pAp phosphatase (c-di-AMP/oligoRNAs hydrolase)